MAILIMSDHALESELLTLRREKLDKLRALGVKPYAYQSKPTHAVGQALQDFDQLAEAKTTVTLAGRIRSWRPHGGSIFFSVEDTSGRIQIYAKKDILQADQFAILDLMDIGDFIEVTGTLFVTKMGEKTLSTTHLRVLSKSLRPLPSEWYGLKDIEIRHRKRYLDMLINPEVRDRFLMRARIIQLVREFLHERGFVEIETPVLQVLYGGTNATPFKTHINAFDMPMYLRIAPELYLKRLVVGGVDRVFEIAKNFRNEGVDQTHNPEFTMIEWYEAYADYNDMMDTAEALYKHIARDIFGMESIPLGDKQLALGGAWPRLPLKSAIKQYLSVDVDLLSDEQLQSLLDEHHIVLKGAPTRGLRIFTLFDKLVAPSLEGPIWIIDYPREVSPLSKEHRLDPTLVERYECYLNGRELGDGWSEIISPIEQRSRFENEQSNLKHGDSEAHPLDEEFLEAMEYGMPPLGGIGIGIDRLVMTFTNTQSIREVIPFPIMKPEKKADEPEDYSNPVRFLPLTQPEPSLFTIAANTETEYPGIKIGVAIIEGVTVEKTNAKLVTLKAEMLPQLERYSKDEWRNSHNLMRYRDMYKQFGVDPNSKRPSADALLHRLSHGKGLYSINTVVDTYNLFSAKHEHCMAAYDADQVKFPLQLRASIEGDSVQLIGDDAVSSVEPGRLVYADQVGVTCLNFNYRDAERTKVTEQTKRLILFVDGCGEMTYAEIHASLSQTATAIADVTGGQVVSVSITTSAGRDKEPVETVDTSEFIQDALQGDPGITRAEALELMESMIENMNLRKHALTVEAALRFYARQLGANEDLWGITGLLHDADWEKHPDQHPKVIVKLLRERGVHPAIPQAIACHGKSLGFPQISQLDKYLFACDELTGMITATALVRPDKSIAGVQVKSVKKKLKDNAFAKGVHREDVYYGLELIGLDLDEHILNVLTAMQGISEELGL